MSRLKDEPLELENPIFKTLEFINGERYLLRKFSYHEDILEHIQGSKLVDMKEMDKVEEGLEKEKATMRKDEMTGVWIGGGMKPKEQRTNGIGVRLDTITNSIRVVNLGARQVIFGLVLCFSLYHIYAPSAPLQFLCYKLVSSLAGGYVYTEPLKSK